TATITGSLSTVKGTSAQGIAYLSKTDSQGSHSHSLSGTAVSAGAHAHTVGIGAHQHPVVSVLMPILSVLVHTDTPSPLTLRVTRKAPSKTLHLT
ncbi:hypothetical protein, partial [Pseudomonas viridiflava]|uniref:hypothetical protein n=1 Tax=Pseudomonas viridiflava TaxID=33069 RepID=UPI003F6E3371